MTNPTPAQAKLWNHILLCGRAEFNARLFADCMSMQAKTVSVIMRELVELGMIETGLRRGYYRVVKT